MNRPALGADDIDRHARSLGVRFEAQIELTGGADWIGPLGLPGRGALLSALDAKKRRVEILYQAVQRHSAATTERHFTASTLGGRVMICVRPRESDSILSSAFSDFASA